MKHAGRWTALVFALALCTQLSAQAKPMDNRLAKEIAANDAYNEPYSPTTVTYTAKPVGSLIKLEPTIGLTMSTFTGTTTQNYTFSARTGYAAGVGILVGRNSLQFETGISYAERGGKETFEMGTSKWDIEYKNRFIEIPLMARYTFETSKDTRLFVKAGVNVAVLQDSSGNVTNAQNVNGLYAANGMYNYNYNYNYYLANGQTVNDGNTKSYFNPTDIRYAGAIGGIVYITRQIAWTMQADYQMSISRVSSSQPNGYVGQTPFELKSTTYGLNTGVLISL